MEKFIHLGFSHFKKIVFVVLIFLFTVSLEVNAGVNPPDPGGDPTAGGGTPVGGGAPVGEGVYLLLGAAVAYSIWKMQKTITNQKNSLNRE